MPLKMTRHNGRSGKNGTYNPKHNDRRFDIANSDHINQDRAKQNVYWDCYQGSTFPRIRNRRTESFIPLSRSSELTIWTTISITAKDSMNGTGRPGTPAETGHRKIS